MGKYSSEKKDNRHSLKVLEATYQALEDAKDRLRRISGRRLSNDKLIQAALESLEAATKRNSWTSSPAALEIQGELPLSTTARRWLGGGPSPAICTSGSPGPAQDLLSICRQTLLSD